MKEKRKIVLTRWTLVVLMIAAMEVLVRRFGVRYVIVAPSVMVVTLWKLIASGELSPHLGATAAEISLAFLLALTFGLPIGVLLGINKTLRETFDPYLVAYY